MPTMPRLPGKSKKIAYSILGIPANIDKKKPYSAKIDKTLTWQESYNGR